MPAPDDEAQNASRLLHQRMAEIGVRFLARSQQDVDTMDQLLLRMRAGDPAATAALRQLAHRVNGAAASLGFPDLSTHAATVERLTTIAAGGPVLPETVRAIGQEIVALRAALAGRADRPR